MVRYCVFLFAQVHQGHHGYGNKEEKSVNPIHRRLFTTGPRGARPPRDDIARAIVTHEKSNDIDLGIKYDELGYEINSAESKVFREALVLCLIHRASGIRTHCL